MRRGLRINPSTCVGPHIKDDIGDLNIHIEGFMPRSKVLGDGDVVVESVVILMPLAQAIFSSLAMEGNPDVIVVVGVRDEDMMVSQTRSQSSSHYSCCQGYHPTSWA
jgi:hypothetical protein